MAKRALTDAAIKRLKPPAKGQVDIFDRGYPGLALRVSYGGNRSWVVFYRFGGRLKRLRLGIYPALSLADARDAWRKAREDAQAGRDPSRVRQVGTGATDFAGVAKEWLLRDQAKNRQVHIVTRMIERDVTPSWGHREIASISRRDVLDVIDAIVDRGSPVMARRVHGHLHRLFKWAVGRGIIESNPLADLPKPHHETKRDRVLTDLELVAVWKACENIPSHFANAVRLLVLTGARLNEIGHLRWAEINKDEIVLEGARTKMVNRTSYRCRFLRLPSSKACSASTTRRIYSHRTAIGLLRDGLLRRPRLIGSPRSPRGSCTICGARWRLDFKS